MMLGAISLVLNYPANLLEVTSVKVEDQDKGNLIYNAENGELRIAWYNINALNLETGETILHIGFKAGNLDNVQNDGIIFNLGSGSEIANREGSALQHVELVTPKLIHATPSFDVNIYPNPTNGSTQFVYLLPEEGKINIKIYDMLGKEVAALINATKDAGSNYLTFNANSLTPGIYICHVIYTSSTQTRTMIKRLEIIK